LIFFFIVFVYLFIYLFIFYLFIYFISEDALSNVTQQLQEKTKRLADLTALNLETWKSIEQQTQIPHKEENNEDPVISFFR
jgi:hypothetical protein